MHAVACEASLTKIDWPLREPRGDLLAADVGDGAVPLRARDEVAQMSSRVATR
jgi:hypothetical protein